MAILGATKPGEIGIKAPKMANNKRHGKRLKSKKEKATEKKKKKARACATCDDVGHDSRNCPDKMYASDD